MLVVVLLMLMTMMVVVAIMVTAVVLTLVMRVWLSLLLHGSWILWVLLPVATMVSFTMVLAVALSSMIHAAIVRVRSVSMLTFCARWWRPAKSTKIAWPSRNCRALIRLLLVLAFGVLGS